MENRFQQHVEGLVADAEREAASGDWKAARALAEAALALHADEPRARKVLRGAETALARSGERRQLTVMFCDVVGSTQLSSQADPEIIRDILRSYQATCADVVGHYDGHLAAYIGDGVVAYFGYPHTHEDDPWRAVQAGLDLLESLEEVAAAARRRFDLSFAVRIAVHTGLVVRAEMGGPGRRDVDAIVGVTPNVAARLQEHAAPGTLIVSSSTNDLVRGLFSVRALGPLSLKGIPRPIEAFAVLGASGDDSPAPSAFCNRHKQLAALQSGWDAAAGGGRTAVIVSGEPGIGKSRLAEEFRRRVDAAGGATLRCACSSFHTSTALLPVRRLVEVASGVDSRGDPERALPQLRDALAQVGKEDLLGVFADLLGIPPGPGWEPPELDGPQLREVTFSALVEWLATATQVAPTLVLIDDLQWADASTRELIGRVVQREIPQLMLLLTARDDFSPPWSDAVTVIPLDRMAGAELRAIAESLPEAEGLRAEIIDNAVLRSGGVPLFLEELVRAADATPADFVVNPDAAIPAALVSPLLARLAAPGVDLGLCQTIATIGQEADYEVLAAVVGLPNDVLDTRLRVLVAAHLVEPVGSEDRAYRFRHDLVRELAYETQLRPERRRLHGAIADVLETLEVHGLPRDSGVIGHHLEQAGRIADAVEAYTRTARESLAHGAMTEAIEQLDRCLKLLSEVADQRLQDRLELSIRQVRAMAWVSHLGYSAPVAVEDFRRCVELCEQLGADAGPVPSIEAIWYYYTLRGELDRAENIVLVDRRRLDLGPDAIPEEGARCAIRFFRGDFRGATADLESFLASPYARNATEVPAQWPLPDDPLVNSWSFLGLARWLTADPLGSRSAFAEAEQRASRLPFPHGPFGAAYIKNLQVITARFAGLDDEADALVDDLAAIAGKHGFAFFSLSADAQRMIGVVRRGDDNGLGTVTNIWRALGIEAWSAVFMLEEGVVALRSGANDVAAQQAGLAIEWSESTGVGFLLAESYRLRGRARRAAGDTGSADDLDMAIGTARRQGATLFELRALLDRVQSPDADQARAELASLVDTLAEVDGLAELEEARAAVGTGPGSG